MASLKEFPIEPRHFDPEEQPPLNPTAVYDEESDTLVLHLYGPPEPAITVPIDDDVLYWRVHPETHIIVGVEIELFVDVFLREHPELIEIADLVDVPAERIEKIRGEIDSDTYRRAAVSLILSRFAPEPVGV